MARVFCVHDQERLHGTDPADQNLRLMRVTDCGCARSSSSSGASWRRHKSASDSALGQNNARAKILKRCARTGVKLVEAERSDISHTNEGQSRYGSEPAFSGQPCNLTESSNPH